MLTCHLPCCPPPSSADSGGRVVSFKNTLIILTSNVGSSVIAKGGSSIGFELPSAAGDAEGDKYSRVRTLVLEELKVRGVPARGLAGLLFYWLAGWLPGCLGPSEGAG